MVKLVLLSTWGDQHYMGLNGIELYDEGGRLLPVSKCILFNFLQMVARHRVSSSTDPRLVAVGRQQPRL